jgi:Tol biopolymer transport system component
MFLMIFINGTIGAQTPDQLFQKGIMKEEGEGSLKEAIELYKSVADNTKADKVLRAKALYQMGNCYEKLGQQEARIVYEKLVANYTDPQELVANAKRKLNKLQTNKSFPENSGITIRQINDADENNVAHSYDGQFVTYNNWDSIRIEIKNLQNGQKWAVTKNGNWNEAVIQYMDLSLWSPDSKQIIYGWLKENNSKKEFTSELHIVNRDGTNDKIIKSSNNYYCYPIDWSTDGRYFLYGMVSDSVFSLMLYTFPDGKEKQITSLSKMDLGTCHFTPDNEYVIFDMPQGHGSENYNIYSVSLSGREITQLISFKEDDRSPHVIPNTNQVVFFSFHTGAKELWAMTVENGKLVGEPRPVKSGIDENSKIKGVLNDGTVLYATYRLNPDFFYAKLDINNNNIFMKNLDIVRNSSRKIVRTIWSPSLSKCAIITGGQFITPYIIKLKMVEYEMNGGKERELATNLVTFAWQPWIEPQWTPDEKSVLIKAQTQEIDKKPRGIYRFNFNANKVEEYATQNYVFSNWQWKGLQFSIDGKTQYFASRDSFYSSVTRLIAKSVETGAERIITQFDKEIETFFLSPDEKLIAVKYENELRIILVDNPSEMKKIENPYKNWGTLLGWTNDSKSLLVQKPEGKEAWSIWIQPLDGQPAKQGISADKLKPFFGAGGLMIHHVGNDTFLSMQYGKKIYELWAIENIVQK